jgi:radical SAM superfamily enzyme YgiQ (UPF0313 family)
VFISLMMVQRDDYDVCVATAKARGKPIAVGGPFTHALPEVAVADADWVCFGEAESIIDAFVHDLREGIRGKQYQGGNNTDMTAVLPPRFDLLQHMHEYVCMPIQFSRGCPFRCEFCDIIEIYGRVPRTKRPSQILAELSALERQGFRGTVFLVDDNFIGNKKNAHLLLKELAVWSREHGHPFRFFTEASLNLADDEKLLDLMFRANFVKVFIGIETPDSKLLKGALKLQNVPGDPLTRLRRIREYGIHVIAGFIIGFDGEEKTVFDVQRGFIEASGIGTTMIGLLQALPHTELSRRLKREGRLLEDLRCTGVSTAEGINFVPNGEVTKREYLERYSALVKELFEPEAYFKRILPALLTLRYRSWHRGLFVVWRDFPVFLRQVYYLGIRSKSVRPHFWRTLLRVLSRNPFALEAFSHDCFFFYYLQYHVDHVQRELLNYLSAPLPNDVLDEIACPNSARAATMTAAAGRP